MRRGGWGGGRRGDHASGRGGDRSKCSKFEGTCHNRRTCSYEEPIEVGDSANLGESVEPAGMGGSENAKMAPPHSTRPSPIRCPWSSPLQEL